jgi:hypothetical protein
MATAGGEIKRTLAFKGVKGLAGSSLEHTENISSAPLALLLWATSARAQEFHADTGASFCTLPPSQS